MKRMTLLALALIVALLAVAGCATPPAGQSGTANYAGKWNSEFGVTTIVQNGDKISGDWDNKAGTFEGTVTGATLRYTWVSGKDGGRGVFVMDANGKYAKGTWGNGQSETDGGDWNLTAAK